jgi:hypothetical protein
MGVGCNDAPSTGAPAKSDPPPADAPADPPKASQIAPAVATDPYLDGWERPAAALVLTGEVHGYFEPCGCSPTQSGGFARRGRLFRQLEQKGWPLAALDVGGLLKRANRQDQIKFETMLAGMQEMHYAGIGLGVEELLLGPDYLLTQYVPDDPKSIPFLGANVVFFNAPDLGTPLHHRVISVGDAKIGVTAVLGLSLKESVAPSGVENNISILDPRDVLPKVVEDLKAQNPDFLVLLSHGTKEEAKRLAEAYPAFRIILTAGSPDDAAPRPTVVNETWIIETGVKGRTVGVLGYFPQDEKDPFRYELIELDNRRFSIDDRMVALMRTYQQRLEDEKISQSARLVTPHPTGWSFVGAETCGECHRKAYEHWKETGHAKATDTLVHGRAGEEAHWVPRLFDPECLSCHTTGWDPQQYRRYESGYLSEEASAHLRGQQCENCHGPGSKHTEVERAYAMDAQSVSQDELESLRKAVRRRYEDAEKQNCAHCHDAENSPNFNFEDYWQEVVHPWKD